jgi:chromosome segregation ATPase
MNQTQSVNISTLKAEVAQFREELNIRDRLVQQLSQELFRLVKDPTDYAPRTGVNGGEDYRAEVILLREQLQGVEQQVVLHQEQLQLRDFEIHQLRQTVRDLQDRGQMLEQVIRELPKIYTRKFAERLAPIKTKIMELQNDNLQLQAELVSVTERLAAQGANIQQSKTRFGLDLPNINQQFPRSGNFFSHV